MTSVTSIDLYINYYKCFGSYFQTICNLLLEVIYWCSIKALIKEEAISCLLFCEICNQEPYSKDKVKIASSTLLILFFATNTVEILSMGKE